MAHTSEKVLKSRLQEATESLNSNGFLSDTEKTRESGFQYLAFLEENEEIVAVCERDFEGKKVLCVLALNDLFSGNNSLEISAEELANYEKLQNSIEIGRKCFHYSNPELLYTVMGLTFLANKNVGVIYQPDYLETKMYWIRVVDNFFEKVENDGIQTTRFTFLD